MLKKKDFICLLIIFLITFTVYSNTLFNDFVWDDHYFVFREEIKDLSNIPSFFLNDVEGVYRPLRTAFYSLAYNIFGENPFFYHLFSLFIHISIIFTIYFFIKKITKEIFLSFLTALFFGIHPIHTEAVSFITSSFDNIGILFFFLSLFFYLGATKRDCFLSFIFFILAVLTYEVVIVLPLLVILIDFFKKSNIKTKIKNYIPFFLIAGFFLFIRFFLIKVVSRVEEPLGASYMLTLLTMPKIVLDYIFLLFFSFNLSVNHKVVFAQSYIDPVAIFSTICLLGLILAAFYLFKKNKIISFTIFWFLITLLPFSNIIPLQRLIAEVYLYVPSLGFCLLIAYLITKVKDTKLTRKKSIKIIVLCILLLLVFGYSFLTMSRNTDWKSNISLWTATVKTSPLSSKAHNNLAIVYEEMGEIDKAVQEYKISININPKRVKPYISLGVLYYNQGDYANAKLMWVKAVEIDPGQERIKNNIRLLEERGY